MGTARISNLILLLILFVAGAAHGQHPEVVYADFEGETYGDWTATGTAFGDGPAAGTLPH